MGWCRACDVIVSYCVMRLNGKEREGMCLVRMALDRVGCATSGCERIEVPCTPLAYKPGAVRHKKKRALADLYAPLRVRSRHNPATRLYESNLERREHRVKDGKAQPTKDGKA